MLDHTADAGFEVRAPTLGGLFEEALRGLLLVMFERPPERGGDERRVSLAAPDLETLLVRWLNELAYLIQEEGFVPSGGTPGVGESPEGFSLAASLSGTGFDPEAQGWQGEVKSATFHGLAVERGEGGWMARVILDV
jgi:SHS2 domain-containing protein